jgi:hypothetical protein
MRRPTLAAALSFAVVIATLEPAQAETIEVRSGTEHRALQQPAAQMSCRHLRIRTGQASRMLDTFASELGQASQAAGRGELSAFFAQRTGCPPSLLLEEPVYRIRYAIKDPSVAKPVAQSQTSALWGVGLFELRDPNGRFTQHHFVMGTNESEEPWLELDVRAADVCLTGRIEVAFLSGCPTETIRFEGEPASPPFVTHWWRCSGTTTLSFDLSALAGELGRRLP